MEEEIASPNFWQDERKAAKTQKAYSELKEKIESIEDLAKQLNYLKELSPLVKEDTEEEKEIKQKIKDISLAIGRKEKEFFLSGPYDKRNAILTIEAGAGGRDAEDWVAMLSRMYQRFCERKNWEYKILSQTFTKPGGPEGRIGLRDVSLEIRGKYAFGFLKKESGVHRLVRISPFSSQSLRHTSFAGVEVLPDVKIEETDVKIRPDDLKIETFKASGPGGQYVNKRQSAVRIIHLPTGITVSCQVERLLGENRQKAMKILVAKLHQLQLEKKERELKEIKAKKLSPDFGSQIRSYVLHPYKLVKDLRTGVETSNVEVVLDGGLDKFIEAETRI